ncbi:hypothetical protein [Ligilactobacillus equi]|uniref:Uncharacterized protein n=1 Tax=Ligilactobacillus equi DPC 6820 TaxID=1392007 RepID=V7HXA9_9LACO|nr:hypothetical protein [Ligilactobacillus equi]ETA74532.1 hypothetical protein LEQ_0397 [Ligilactobacillus equi DPC 6820]
MFTSLFKKKNNTPGKTKTKPTLKFKVNDDLHARFRKIANYINKTTDLENININDVIKTMLIDIDCLCGYERIEFAPSLTEDEVFEKFKLQRIYNNEKDIDKIGTLMPARIHYTDNKKKSNLVVIKFLNQEKIVKLDAPYHYRSMPDISIFTFSRAEYGYTQIIKDISNVYFQEERTELETKEFKDLLDNISNKIFSKQKSYFRFYEISRNDLELEELYKKYLNGEIKANYDDPQNIAIEVEENGVHYNYKLAYLKKVQVRNDIIRFCEQYTTLVYGAALQQRYESDLDKLTHARAWEDKKQVNLKTQNAAKNDRLNKYFTKLEFDNDVDLEKLPAFSKEVSSLMEYVLPSTSNIPTLRLRKLGNYRALGMYVNLLNNLVIDFRDNQDYKDTPTLSGIGIQSFIHEYGHYLDYQLNPEEQQSSTLEFRDILIKYTDKMKNLASFNQLGNKATSEQLTAQQLVELPYVLKHFDYYITPTEVFARAFEIYMDRLGLKTSVIKPHQDYVEKLVYAQYKGLEKEIENYFDNLFPSLREAVKDYDEKHISNKQAKPSPTIPMSSAADHEKLMADYPDLVEEQHGDVIELTLAI